MPFLLQLPTSSKLRSLFKYLSSLESLPGYQVPVAEHLENTKSQEEPELDFQLAEILSVPCISPVMFNKQFLTTDFPV